MIDARIQQYYDQGAEEGRLTGEGGSLEAIRTRELLERFLPAAPAQVLDVGGGAGVYAAWLAEQGYQVHLIDPVPLHVEQATRAAAAQPAHSFTAVLGDARRLVEADGSQDVVLLLGPLYHLTERAERLTALAEARRVLRPGGLLAAAVISRFASVFDILRRDAFDEPGIAAMLEQDLRDGQHRNPDADLRPGWFTTAYFHHPDELAAEVREAGFGLEGIFGIEGPGGWISDAWDDPRRRESLLFAARAVEKEPTLMGVSAHLLAVARKGG